MSSMDLIARVSPSRLRITQGECFETVLTAPSLEAILEPTRWEDLDGFPVYTQPSGDAAGILRPSGRWDLGTLCTPIRRNVYNEPVRPVILFADGSWDISDKGYILIGSTSRAVYLQGVEDDERPIYRVDRSCVKLFKIISEETEDEDA